ncbi:hypothetical protein CYMTET_55150 [Cymbomonas tetramitiformis]|uniref:(+)RNA virus helicase C-terminal domain-containing protein n=2 Tax=Cymbomonas tetramitiformis TaxID=36881 RepID=A0AAE0BEM9_9CHLO|nr:hypothetical protein CYMTET_55150 [Cymbomonas tetramitiformis]
MMVELQHSPMTGEEYANRNAGVTFATWIFDATEEDVMKYQYAEGIWFCSDRFHETYNSDADCRVLFHCNDGNIYQTASDDVVDIETNGERKYVRMLKTIDAEARRMLDKFFGRMWPLKHWDGAPTFRQAATIDTPVRVLSEAGRPDIDRWHRNFMYRFPSVPRIVVSAPPGAGKTTEIIEMMRRWQKRALVITFNKGTQETMQQRIQQAGLTADARTLDSLCYDACSRPELMQKWSDWELCNKFWPKSAKFKFGKSGGGRRSSNIIDFRFRHPRAHASICKQHRRLALKGSDWDGKFTSYPVQKIVQSCMTHAACRYVCDQRCSLRAKLDAYDVILVDEMQDLISAQEQRLLFQTSKPVVLVGDPMQAINNFRDDPPCTSCHLEQENAPALSNAIEWYGTWRLDSFTVRFVEERFERRMYSYRAVDDTSEVYWKDELVHAKTLVICRCNKNVVGVAMRYPDMRVVRGDTLAQQLAIAAKDDSMVTPMAKYAQELARSGELDTVCQMLRERSVRLADVNDMAAVTTVHQVKGFEYDHCAVHSDLLAPENRDERNISFVAFTRHRKSLVVMAKSD